MTKLFDLDKGQTASDLVEELADLPQPLFLYYFDDSRGDWLVASEVEIHDDDLESVIYQLIEDYDEENEDGEDDYDYTADDRNYDMANGR